MALFRNPFFKSDNEAVEYEYSMGVINIRKGKFYDALTHLNKAAEGGHVSAYYNLAIIHGSGRVSPWNFDIAADCWYKSAEFGHPEAKKSLWLIEAADRGGFGYDNIVKMFSRPLKNGEIDGEIMTCAARFTDVLCKKYGATNDVIAYEIDAARQSEDVNVQRFVHRTGISEEFSSGGLDRLVTGSVADQITDGLNNLSITQGRFGMDPSYIRMIRCSIIGYVIQKSAYGGNSQSLLGIDRFFK